MRVNAPPGCPASPGSRSRRSRTRRRRALARTAGVELVAGAYGTTDATGGEAVNLRLREQRARWLADALAARGVDGIVIDLVAPAAGSPQRRGAQLRVVVAEDGR